MKQSPFQLRHVFYPTVSFAANANVPDGHEDDAVVPKLHAEVKYSEDGVHSASIHLTHSNDDNQSPFSVNVEAVATFTFDLEVAKVTYKAGPVPVFIAVNVCRVLYSGARELLATVSARSPYGSVMIEAQVIEPKDVKLGFDADPVVLMPKLFEIEFPGTSQAASAAPSGDGDRIKAIQKSKPQKRRS